MPYRLSSTTVASHRLPMAPRIISRGQDFSYSSPGWSTGSGDEWKGSSSSSSSSSSKGASSAAVSALALLAFLFFLNMLQQQLALGQQQTLLFMTNSSNFTRFRRVRRPFVPIAAIKARNGLNGRAKMTIQAMKNAKLKLRRQRDLDGVDAPDNEQYQLLDTDTDEYDPGTDIEKELPFMMPGLPHGSSMQLSAWLKGQLTADELKNDLVDTLTNCRAVVACTVYKISKEDHSSQTVLSEDDVRKLLGEAGEYAELGHLEEACKDLLRVAGEECNLLAKSFSSIIPNAPTPTVSTTVPRSAEPLFLSQNVKGDF